MPYGSGYKSGKGSTANEQANASKGSLMPKGGSVAKSGLMDQIAYTGGSAVEKALGLAGGQETIAKPSLQKVSPEGVSRGVDAEIAKHHSKHASSGVPTRRDAND